MTERFESRLRPAPDGRLLCDSKRRAAASFHCAALGLLFSLVLARPVNSEEPVRTWTNNNGNQTIVGKFVRLEGDRVPIVVLEDKKGRLLRIELGRFSVADRIYLGPKLHEQIQNAADQAAKPAKSVKQPRGLKNEEGEQSRRAAEQRQQYAAEQNRKIPNETPQQRAVRLKAFRDKQREEVRADIVDDRGRKEAVKTQSIDDWERANPRKEWDRGGGEKIVYSAAPTWRYGPGAAAVDRWTRRPVKLRGHAIQSAQFSGPEAARMVVMNRTTGTARGADYGSGDELQVYDAAQGRWLKSVTLPVPMRLAAVSPSGNLLVLQYRKNELVLWPLDKGKAIVRLAPYGNEKEIPGESSRQIISFVGFPDDHHLLTCGRDVLTLWSIKQENAVYEAEIPKSRPTTVLSPDGRYLLMTDRSGPGAVVAVDTQTGRHAGQIACDNNSSELAISRDGKTLLGARFDRDHTVMKVWDLVVGRQSNSFSIPYNNSLSELRFSGSYGLMRGYRHPQLGPVETLFDLTAGRAIWHYGGSDMSIQGPTDDLWSVLFVNNESVLVRHRVPGKEFDRRPAAGDLTPLVRRGDAIRLELAADAAPESLKDFTDQCTTAAGAALKKAGYEVGGDGYKMRVEFAEAKTGEVKSATLQDRAFQGPNLGARSIQIPIRTVTIKLQLLDNAGEVKWSRESQFRTDVRPGDQLRNDDDPLQVFGEGPWRAAMTWLKAHKFPEPIFSSSQAMPGGGTDLKSLLK